MLKVAFETKKFTPFKQGMVWAIKTPKIILYSYLYL
jgi:hypothetical protein